MVGDTAGKPISDLLDLLNCTSTELRAFALARRNRRLKYLLNCKSVIVAHELGWVQTFHPVFNSDPSSPDQNIVIVKGPGWSGLMDEMEALLGDDERARRIAENSYKTFRQRY